MSGPSPWAGSPESDLAGSTPAGRCGLDRLLAEEPGKYGKTGWFANGAAAAASNGTLVWGPIAALAAGFDVVQLFGPEHGPHGAAPAGEKVKDHYDNWTGLPVCSLYGPEPANLEAALGRCNTVVVDLVELGARYSTNLALAAALVEHVAGAGAGQRVVVLDRPNPLGREMEGPRLERGFASLVGRLDVPVRHGLTVGELLRWFVRAKSLDVDLSVLGAQIGDPRPVRVGERPYLPPSPNLNCLEAQLLYPGTCLVEGTNLSEGRGTAVPFQVVGAPWLDARRVAEELAGSPGISARAVKFVPQASKHAGQLCEGVFLHIVDHQKVRPVSLAVRLLSAIFARHEEAEVLPPREPGGARFIDLLWGSAGLGDRLAARLAPAELPSCEGFAKEVASNLLYGPSGPASLFGGSASLLGGPGGSPR